MKPRIRRNGRTPKRSSILTAQDQKKRGDIFSAERKLMSLVPLNKLRTRIGAARQETADIRHLGLIELKPSDSWYKRFCHTAWTGWRRRRLAALPERQVGSEISSNGWGHQSVGTVSTRKAQQSLGFPSLYHVERKFRRDIRNQSVRSTTGTPRQVSL